MKKSKKEKMKEKALKKKERIKRREDIIDIYIHDIKEKCIKFLLDVDEAFDNITFDISDLEVKYINLKAEYDNILSSNSFDVHDINKIITEFIELDKYKKKINTELANPCSSQLINKIGSSHGEIVHELDTLRDDLKNDIDGEYIYSLTKSRAQRYLDDNREYFDKAVKNCELYMKSLNNTVKSFGTSLLSSEAEVQKKLIRLLKEERAKRGEKYKERLRVEYYELEKFLIFKGYEFNRQNSTTHAIWRNKITGQSITLPNKSKTIPQGTVGRILNQIGATRNELAAFLKKKKEKREKGEMKHGTIL